MKLLQVDQGQYPARVTSWARRWSSLDHLPGGLPFHLQGYFNTIPTEFDL